MKALIKRTVVFWSDPGRPTPTTLDLIDLCANSGLVLGKDEAEVVENPASDLDFSEEAWEEL